MNERKDPFSVGAWMTSNPITIAPDVSVRDAFFRMRIDEVRHLPVTENGRLVGMVTDRDLRRPDLTDEPDGWNDFYDLDSDYEVRHVMADEPVTVSPQDRLESAVMLLAEHRFGALPVLDKKGDLVGIVSSQDVNRAFVAVMKAVGDQLRRDAAGR